MSPWQLVQRFLPWMDFSTSAFLAVPPPSALAAVAAMSAAETPRSTSSFETATARPAFF